MLVPPPSEPPTIRGTFHLTDHNGRDVDAESFRGSFVLVLFGFTHLPGRMPAGTDKALRRAGWARRNRCPSCGVVHHGRSGS
jgi:SCO1/SenC